MTRPGKVPDHLTSTVDMLRRAFPSGLPGNLRLPLIAVLAEEMGAEAIMNAFEILGFAEPLAVINEELLVRSDTAPQSPDEVEQMRLHLSQFGYEDWLLEQSLDRRL